jgi:hypothetical protein
MNITVRNINEPDFEQLLERMPQRAVLDIEIVDNLMRLP